LAQLPPTASPGERLVAIAQVSSRAPQWEKRLCGSLVELSRSSGWMLLESDDLIAVAVRRVD
jgi:hypothetical protein